MVASHWVTHIPCSWVTEFFKHYMYLVLFGLFCTPMSSMKTHTQKIPPNRKTNRVILEFSVQVPLNQHIYSVLRTAALRATKSISYLVYLTMPCYHLQAIRMITEQSLKSRGPQFACTHYSRFRVNLISSTAGSYVVLHIRNIPCFQHVRETKHWCKCASEWELKTLI